MIRSTDWLCTLTCVIIIVINGAFTRDFDLNNWEVATNAQNLVADETIMQQLPEDSFAFQEDLVSDCRALFGEATSLCKCSICVL